MKINDKVYGKQIIKEPLILELINSSELQRLKRVGQYGTWSILEPKFNTTRFEHSFGVYTLLKIFNASLEEQISGLLHDVNHTAFSHVIDYVLGDPSLQEFGDSNHRNVIMNSDIPSSLKKWNIDVNKVIHHDAFGLLERELPDLCSDRLDYCLRDSICCGFINQKDASRIIKGLVVNNGEIICKDKETSLEIGNLFLTMSKYLWSNMFQAGSYVLLADAIKLGLKQGIINENDFYTSDKILLDKLVDSKNRKIIDNVDHIKSNSLLEGTEKDHDIFARSKARIIDPKYLYKGKIMRLSESDKIYRNNIADYKAEIKKGFYIKLKK